MKLSFFHANRLRDRMDKARMIAFFSVVVLLTGCAGSDLAQENNFYDLGGKTAIVDAPIQPTLSGKDQKMFELNVVPVTATAYLQTDRILYRFMDAKKVSAYAYSFWVAAPAKLLGAKVRDAVAAQGVALSGANLNPAVPVLKIELEQFEQIFDTDSVSYGQVVARVSLLKNEKIIVQQTFTAAAPASTANAQGGVQALAVASDDLVDQIMVWVCLFGASTTKHLVCLG